LVLGWRRPPWLSRVRPRARQLAAEPWAERRSRRPNGWASFDKSQWWWRRRWWWRDNWRRCLWQPRCHPARDPRGQRSRDRRFGRRAHTHTQARAYPCRRWHRHSAPTQSNPHTSNTKLDTHGRSRDPRRRAASRPSGPVGSARARPRPRRRPSHRTEQAAASPRRRRDEPERQATTCPCAAGRAGSLEFAERDPTNLLAADGTPRARTLARGLT
jgi:hypothetical protein